MIRRYKVYYKWIYPHDQEFGELEVDAYDAKDAAFQAELIANRIKAVNFNITNVIPTK